MPRPLNRLMVFPVIQRDRMANGWPGEGRHDGDGVQEAFELGRQDDVHEDHRKRHRDLEAGDGFAEKLASAADIDDVGGGQAEVARAAQDVVQNVAHGFSGRHVGDQGDAALPALAVDL